MMRQVGGRDPQLFLNLPHHHAARMGGKQKLHDAQARFGSHGGEHVGIAGDPPLFHISIIMETWNLSSEPPRCVQRAGKSKSPRFARMHTAEPYATGYTE